VTSLLPVIGLVEALVQILYIGATPTVVDVPPNRAVLAWRERVPAVLLYPPSPGAGRRALPLMPDRPVTLRQWPKRDHGSFSPPVPAVLGSEDHNQEEYEED